MTPLIRQNDTASNNVLLSITSVIHSYGLWATENDDKETKETIISTITFLENILNDTLSLNTYSRDKVSRLYHGMHRNQTLVVRYRPTHDFEFQTIVLLKSLGNAGVLTSTIRYTLSSCISNYLYPAEVRIAAIEAHRYAFKKKKKNFFP